MTGIWPGGKRPGWWLGFDVPNHPEKLNFGPHDQLMTRGRFGKEDPGLLRPRAGADRPGDFALKAILALGAGKYFEGGNPSEPNTKAPNRVFGRRGMLQHLHDGLSGKSSPILPYSAKIVNLTIREYRQLPDQSRGTWESKQISSSVLPGTSQGGRPGGEVQELLRVSLQLARRLRPGAKACRSISEYLKKEQHPRHPGVDTPPA